MQPTSIENYIRARDDGTLSIRRAQVCFELCEGPGTCREIYERLRVFHPRVTKDSINPRFAELEYNDVVRAAMTRPCKFTQRECIVWELTGEIPTKWQTIPKHEGTGCVECYNRGYKDGQRSTGQMSLYRTT